MAKVTAGIFITGTDARVGKTLIGCALAFAAHSRGLRVGVMKPIDVGCREVAGVLESDDARGLAYAAACDLPLDLMCPYRYRSRLAPAAAAEAENIAPPDVLEIVDAYRKIAERSDFVIVEGIGGIATPLTFSEAHSRGLDSARLARALNLDVIVVAANRPECLNASKLTVEYARGRGLAIPGVILNDIDATPMPDVETNLESMRKLIEAPILGRIRHKQPVTRDIIDALLPSGLLPVREGAMG